jgi:hypothetical protein
MEQSQKAALLLSQLRGAAQTLTREIPIDIILQGADINGRRVDPVTYILTMLAERYAQLGEESRLKAMSEIFEFHRRGHERIDDLLARFSTVQQRAQGQGMVALPYESLSWILLRACQPNDQQLLMLLQNFGGRYPNTELEFRQLEGSLRRMGHILENSPDNIAQQLRHDRGHRHPLYMMSQGWQQSYPSWNPNSSWQQPPYSWSNQDNWSNQPMYPSVPWTNNTPSPPPIPVDDTMDHDSETD